MQVEFTISLRDVANRLLHVVVEGQSVQSPISFMLEALGGIPGIEILNLAVTGQHGQAIECNISETSLTIPAPKFRLTYTLKTDYTDCMGADRDVYLMYPFINSHEIFFGVGSIPVPSPLHEWVDDSQVNFAVVDVPAGWQVYSNLMEGVVEPTKLEGFFIYAADNLEISNHTYVTQSGPLQFQLVVQHGKIIPQTPDEIWNFIDRYMTWVERNVGPYRQAREINLLILQAPDDFEQQTQGRAFATGENVPNGIIVYAPNNPDYLWKLFEHNNYAYFLEEGFAHELMHFYTTSNWAGRAKSVLYPTPDCPPADARLIGEALNQYCFNQFMYRDVTEQFYNYYLARALNQQQKRGRRNQILDLFLLDTHLRRQGHSVLALFGAMVAEKQRRPSPYANAQFLLDVANDWLGVDISPQIAALVSGNDIPDYPALMGWALTERGYTLIENQGNFFIRQDT